MTKHFDTIVIGAGHNGLVTAGYLAKAGNKVLVLERSADVGGAAKNREFAEGYHVSACAHILHMLKPKVVKDLSLAAHGLDTSAAGIDTISLDEGGNHLRLGANSVDGADLSDADKAAYVKFVKRMREHAKVLAPQLMKTPPRLASVGLKNAMQLAGMGWALRFGLGKKKMEDFLRIVAMNIHHLLDETFESEALKGALTFDAVLGTCYEARTSTTVLTYLYRVAGGLDSTMFIPKGGMGSVTKALASAATGLGAEIRTDAAVQNIMMENGAAVGVVLAGGEEIRAKRIVSNADAKTTFFNLVGARHLEAGFAHRLSNIRAKGRAAKVHMVLDGLPDFTGLDEAALKNRLVIAPTRKYVDHAFNHSKYEEFSAEPTMEITIPTLTDPSLAPEGKHVLSAVVQYAPYDVKGGWETQKENFIQNVKDVIAKYAPNFKDVVGHAECLTPPDLESEFGLPGGHWHHAELAIDQLFMLRPVHGTAQYKTHVEGLYLCGASAHPGGGVMGAAGHNAAQVILAGDE